MKTYHDIVGDGGSDVLGQVATQQQAIQTALSGVRHLLAVGSGKGGVGKSTVTWTLARALRQDGQRVAILDGDFNGPCQAQLAGLETAPWIPGEHGLALPKNAEGIGVVSFGSLLPEARPVEFDSVAQGEEHTWRATREFALLGQLLGSVQWGELDVLLFDLPPGAERTLQFAQFLSPATAYVLVTIPSQVAHGVVARSVSVLKQNGSRLLGYVENMAGYYCRDCDTVRPLFPVATTDLAIPRLGSIPFDPELASRCDRGWTGGTPEELEDEGPEPVSTRAVTEAARRILQALET